AQNKIKELTASLDNSKKEKDAFTSKLDKKDISIFNLKRQLTTYSDYSEELSQSPNFALTYDKKIEKISTLLDIAENEKKNLLTKLNEKDVSINDLNTQLDKYSSELSQSSILTSTADKKINELTVSLDNSKIDKETYLSKLYEKDVSIKNLKTQLDGYLGKQLQSSDITSDYDKKIENLSVSLETSENEKKFLLTKLAKKDASIKILNSKLDELSQKLSQSATISDNKLSELSGLLESFEKEKKNLLSELITKNNSIKTLKTQLDGYSGKLFQSSDITSDYDKKIENLSVSLETSENEKKFLLTKLAKKDASIKILNSKLDELSRKLSQSATISDNKLSELSGLLESFEKEKKNLLSELITKTNSIKTLKTQFDKLSKKIPQSDNSSIDNSEKIAELTAKTLDKENQIQTLKSLLNKTNIYKSKFSSLELNYSKLLIELNKSQSKIEINDKLLSDKTSQINQLEKTIISIKNQIENMQKESKDKPDITAELTKQLLIKDSQLNKKDNSLNFIKTQLSANKKQINIMKKESYEKTNIVSQLTKKISQLKKDKKTLSLNLLEQNKKEEFLSDQLKEKDLKISRFKSIIEGTIIHIENMSQTQPSN
ncbi:MAG: hypothetical protein KAJ79_05080, partial [Candidatus Omnitrophica bacterium]|nr:hypothetical protein [Candidatus Omnitrophota bacterium]